MSDCFLFFRFWPGFDFDQFPVGQFNAIADDEDLVRALDSYAREEIGRPEVRHRIKQVAKTRRRNLLAAIREQSASRTMVGARAVGVRKRLTKRDWYWPRIRQAKHGDPLVCRLGAYLGWWRQVGSESLPFGPRVWFYQVPSSELAETVVSALNGRTDLHFDDNELEYYLQPRFGFVEDTDVALRISALRCIKSIQQGKIPEVRSGEMALAMGRKAMAIADEMLEAAAPPTPVQEVLAPPLSDHATTNSDSTPEEILRGLKPADRKAYLSFKYAESKKGKQLQDHEAYALLQEEGIPTDRGDLGKLTDYDLPAMDTWTRQLRNARKALGEQKYTPRTGRSHGRSVAKVDET